ncbi:hypothetical protein CWE04_11685 [Thomasclavelia cocleata]|uniref:Uncharacterized protein n=1 Tax=Thomasclavelia cocleata TaxID=69824 RepID=A0A1I0BHQ7_9FIRM|nr:hypothetical protein [Thomasclavelia cocleata]MCR1960235.1 hypothetical protein [Thomasclavelia cocleata]PJN79863.1 hypothetical protein CWE04_11685 [Thomasclavelia cocleata]SET06521.1 hypothetical protein SAMN04489758_101130 [Thomasclavelia cocleata]
MIKIKAIWKNGYNATLQFIDNDKIVNEIELDLIIVDKNNNVMLKQVEKWYDNNNLSKENLELFLILNEYAKKNI